MIPFHYRRIDESLLDALCSNVANGESTVMLAPRFGGSRYTLYRLQSMLSARGVGSLVYLRLARHDELNSEAAIRKLVTDAVERVAGAELSAATAGPSLLEAVERLQRQLGKPLVLFVANVDYLPYHLSSRLLTEVRTLHEAHKVVAVLTGEDSFYDLVSGPNSDFACAHQLVLQGLGREEFAGFAGHYLRVLNLGATGPDELAEMWEQTGGNRHMLRILLWEMLERKVRSISPGTLPAIGSTEMIRQARLPGPYGAEVFRYPARVIEHEPHCWADLQVLIANGEMRVAAEHGPPTVLELAGAATRCGSLLRFASPWMGEYIRHHFSDRRWGDLHARQGRWRRAFSFYSRLAPDETVRPSTAEDRLEVELTIRSLSAALYAEMHNGSQPLRRLFARSCRSVLGYQEVAFWVYRDASWILETPEAPSSEDRKDLERALELLPAGAPQGDGPLPIPGPWKQPALAAVLPGLRPGEQRVLMLSNFKQEAPISKARERLTSELLGHFLTAYKHALAIERDRERLAMRNAQFGVMNSIFGALGSQVLTVRDALAEAAAELRKLGYSRVLFSLVNPSGDRIQPELDDNEDTRSNVASLPDWPLAEPKADLQPYVVRSRRPFVGDVAREPLANVGPEPRAAQRRLAIVPLLNHLEEPIGTLHIERQDQAVPSADEVEDLLQFGRQLAIAIEQIRRVKLLQSALDEIPEPVLIADGSMQLLFTNEPSARLLGRKSGWYGRREARQLQDRELGEVRGLLDESLRKGQRLVRQVHQLAEGQAYRGVALADAIKDDKNRTVGAVLHLQDLNYLYQVLDAFRSIAESHDTDSAMRAVLRAAHALGHRHGRLLLVAEDDPSRLVGHLTLGPDGQIAPDRPGKAEYPRRDATGHRTWECIELRRPMVFCWDEERDDRAQVVTRHGLQAINSKPPQCPGELEKKPGDFWIDFPLFTPREALGKLSLSCDPDLKPEDFHLLRLLAEMAAGVLSAFIQRQRIVQQVEERVLGPVAVQAMAVAAHNIATRLGSLPVLLTRYRKREAKLAELKELNDLVEYTVSEVLRQIKRIKERVATLKVEPRRLDLAQTIRTTLNSMLLPEQWALEGAGQAFEVDADPELLGNAILELVQNSKNMAAVEAELQISVGVGERAVDGAPWVCVSYEDNGPGVPPHLKSRIFEPFFSRRPGRRNSSGLGLFFVRRVLDGHGGSVEESGTLGAGARFVMLFPRFT